MKIEIDMPKCSKEMADAFKEHLNKYQLSFGDVLEAFIFAMERSGRLYDRSQDEPWLAEDFFSRTVLETHGIEFQEYQDFKFAGKVFNDDYLKLINKGRKKKETHNTDNTFTDEKGNSHGGRK